MGIFSRLGDIINSNLNALLDRAEDPQKLARLIIQEMEDTLVEVRSAAARAIADKKALSRRIEQFDASAAEWAAKAEFAVEKGREDLAKGALVAKADALRQADQVRQELVAVTEALAKTEEDLQRLEAKLTEARTKEKAIEIRQGAARDRLRIRTQLHDGRIDEAMERYGQIERKLDHLEGKVEAFDLGRTPDLASQFAALEAESAIERELAAIKARLNRGEA